MTAGPEHRFTADENPLLTDSPEVWDRLLESVQPASLLVIIESRMSRALRDRLTPEDIWQDVLLQVWRDRRQFEWRGLKSFRCWLLTLIDHRIQDAARTEGRLKRGGGDAATPFSALPGAGASGSSETRFLGGVASTTPSRVAMFKEQAGAMRAALDSLPPELSDVVRLRLFEQLTMPEVAERLGIGLSAARHRFLKGAELYQHMLTAELGSRTTRSAECGVRNAD